MKLRLRPVMRIMKLRLRLGRLLDSLSRVLDRAGFLPLGVASIRTQFLIELGMKMRYRLKVAPGGLLSGAMLDAF
jgi:hypothetical protein